MQAITIKRNILEQIMLSIVLDVINDDDINTFNEIYTAYKGGAQNFELINTKLYFEQLLLPIVIQKNHLLINNINDNNIKQTFIDNITKENTIQYPIIGRNQEEHIEVFNNELKQTFSKESGNIDSLEHSLLSHNQQKLKQSCAKCYKITLFIIILLFVSVGNLYFLYKMFPNEFDFLADFFSLFHL